MTSKHALGPFVRRFLLEDVIADRDLSANTQHSYGDTLRLLFRYLTAAHATDPSSLCPIGLPFSARSRRSAIGESKAAWAKARPRHAILQPAGTRSPRLGGD
jgi:hypothetical protein